MVDVQTAASSSERRTLHCFDRCPDTHNHDRFAKRVRDVNRHGKRVPIREQLASDELLSSLYRFGSHIVHGLALGAYRISGLNAVVNVEKVAGHARAPVWARADQSPRCRCQGWSTATTNIALFACACKPAEALRTILTFANSHVAWPPSPQTKAEARSDG